MTKKVIVKKVARRSFLSLITGFSAGAAGIFLGVISPVSARTVQQEGSDSSDQSGRSGSDSDSSDQSGRSGSDSDSSDQSGRSGSDSDSTEGSDSSDRSGR